MCTVQFFCNKPENHGNETCKPITDLLINANHFVSTLGIISASITHVIKPTIEIKLVVETYNHENEIRYFSYQVSLSCYSVQLNSSKCPGEQTFNLGVVVS